MKYLLIMICLITLSACYYDNFEELYPGAGLSDTCDTAGTISFATKVLPIMTGNCGSSQSNCHGGTSPLGFYQLSNHSGVKAANDDGILLPSINHTGGSPMPKNAAKMNDCNIKTIEKWVAQGALNN